MLNIPSSVMNIYCKGSCYCKTVDDILGKNISLMVPYINVYSVRGSDAINKGDASLSTAAANEALMEDYGLSPSVPFLTFHSEHQLPLASKNNALHYER